jgi:hypothetical protein
MPTITDWITACAAVSADVISLVVGFFALRALRENKRAADEAKRSADAAYAQLNLTRPHPIVVAHLLGDHNPPKGLTIRNIGTGTAFDVEISDLVLPGGPAISTRPLPYLEAGVVESGMHRFQKKGFWSEAADEINRSDMEMFIAYYEHWVNNPDGNLLLPLLIRYRAATGESFQTELELRLDKRFDILQLFPKDSLIGAVKPT